MAGDNLARKLPPQKSSREGSWGGSRRSAPQQRSPSSQFTPRVDQPKPRQVATPSTASQLNKAENQSSKRSNIPDLNSVRKNEKISDGKKGLYNPTKGPSSPGGSRFGVWFKNNKGKVLGGVAAIGISGFMTGGLIGIAPITQFLQAANLVKDISSTIHDVVLGARSLKTAKAIKTGVSSVDALKNTRIKGISKVWANSYEKKLGNAGIDIVSKNAGGEFGHFRVDTNKVGGSWTKASLEAKFPGSVVDDVGEGVFHITHPPGASKAAKSDWWKAFFRNLDELGAKVPKASAKVMRTQGVKNLMVGFHPFKQMDANLLNKLDNFVRSGITRKLAKRGIVETAEQIEKRVAKSAVTRIGKAVIGKIPIAGWIFTAVDFGFTLWMKRAAQIAAVSFTLGVSMAKATDILSMADQIKYGERDMGVADQIANNLLKSLGVSTASAEYEDDGNFARQLDYAAQVNLYKEIEIISEAETTLAGSDDNRQVTTDEVYNSLSATNTTKQGSSFFDASLVNAEIDGIAPSEKATMSDTPAQLYAIHTNQANSSDQIASDIINSVVEAVGVGVSLDTFNCGDATNPNLSMSNMFSGCEFDDTGLTPRQIGSEAMYGARVTEKENMRGIGGNQLSAVAAAEMERERVQIVAAEFKKQPWYAKIFDATKYQSVVATIARKASWDPADGSIFTGLRNLAKTFTSTPQLLAYSAGRATPSSYAAYSAGMQSFYNIGSMGYTNEQLEDLPDFVTAANDVHTQLEKLKEDLKDRMQDRVDEYNTLNKLVKGFVPLTSDDVDDMVNRCGADKTFADDIYMIDKDTDSYNIEAYGGAPMAEVFLKTFFTPLIRAGERSITNRYTCGDQFLSILLPKAGIKINSDGEVVPISNSSSASKDSSDECSSGEASSECVTVEKTYNFQDSDVDAGLTPSIQAYILDYQYMVMGAALMADDSDDFNEALSDAVASSGMSESEIENNLISAHTKLVSGDGVGGSTSNDIETRHNVTVSFSNQAGVNETEFNNFINQVMNIYNDDNGWKKAGIGFEKVDSGGGLTIEYTTANNCDTGEEVLEYNRSNRGIKIPEKSKREENYKINVSCHKGGTTIYVYKERWDYTSPSWTEAGGGLGGYRQMLINHETGHYLDWHGLINDFDSKWDTQYADDSHLYKCLTDGTAPIMMQQTLDMFGCTIRSWPEDLWLNGGF